MNIIWFMHGIRTFRLLRSELYQSAVMVSEHVSLVPYYTIVQIVDELLIMGISVWILQADQLQELRCTLSVHMQFVNDFHLLCQTLDPITHLQWHRMATAQIVVNEIPSQQPVWFNYCSLRKPSIKHPVLHPVVEFPLGTSKKSRRDQIASYTWAGGAIDGV